MREAAVWRRILEKYPDTAMFYTTPYTNLKPKKGTPFGWSL